MSKIIAKLLIDTSPAIDSRKSGVGFYVDGLVKALANADNPHFTITGYYFNFLNRKHKTTYQHKNINYKQITYLPGKVIPIFKLFGRLPYLELFIHKPYDITLSTNYVALPKIRKTTSALVIYDLGFIDCPQYVQEKNLKYLQKYCSKSIASSNLIITISEFTKTRIEQEFPSTKNKIIVTHIPPVAKSPTKVAITKRLADLGIKQSQYILYLGTLEPRKNIANLVSAYKKLPKNTQQQYSLVLAGGRGWKDEEIQIAIREAQAKGLNVIVPGYITEEEKSALYSNASLFVLPSHYEGFGMPILEAMQYGIPLAISDISVFHEVADESAVYFNKDDVNDIARVIENLITDLKLQDKLVHTYPVQLNKFSWDKNTKIVFNAFEELVNNER